MDKDRGEGGGGGRGRESMRDSGKRRRRDLKFQH